MERASEVAKRCVLFVLEVMRELSEEWWDKTAGVEWMAVPLSMSCWLSSSLALLLSVDGSSSSSNPGSDGSDGIAAG